METEKTDIVIVGTGASGLFAALHLPTALKAVRREHPRVELRVFTEPTAVLVDKVLDHKLNTS